MIRYMDRWRSCSVWIGTWPIGANERPNRWHVWPCCWCLTTQRLKEIWNVYDQMLIHFTITWTVNVVFSPSLLTWKTIENATVVPAKREICRIGRISGISGISGIWRIGGIRIWWINWNRWDRWNGWDQRIIGNRWNWWVWWLISRLLIAATTTYNFNFIIWKTTGCKIKAKSIIFFINILQAYSIKDL